MDQNGTWNSRYPYEPNTSPFFRLPGTMCDDVIAYVPVALAYAYIFTRRTSILYLKVFLKDKLESELEIERGKWLKEIAKVINNRLWSYAVRKRFLRIKAAIVMIQKIYKVS